MITAARKPLLKGTTQLEDICPSCFASRVTLRGMLQEKPVIREVEYRGAGGCIIRRSQQVGTPNFNIAMMMIDNCPECRKALNIKGV